MHEEASRTGASKPRGLDVIGRLATIKSLKRLSSEALEKGINTKLVLVPTMGALHHGHEALIRHARKIAGRRIVAVSIFVNPTQFGPKEDFNAYPRPLADDFAVCRRAGADAVFLPDAAEMYETNASITVTESRLSNDALRTQSTWSLRRGLHCRRQIVSGDPTHTCRFRRKDWQQLAVIRRMVRDLNFPVVVDPFPDSARAGRSGCEFAERLFDKSRAQPRPRIHAAMAEASTLKTPRAIVKSCTSAISKIPGAKIDYIEAVDASTLDTLLNRKTAGRLAVAVFLGKARLIDNISIPPAT
jgi:pantoate--beta-alanine ligase